MEKQDIFLRLLSDLQPLKLTLASDPDYRKLRFDFDDVQGFLDDKLLHVFLKYKDSHPYEEIKALAIGSLYNVKPRLFRKFKVSTDEVAEETFQPEPLEDKPQFNILLETLGKVLKEEQVIWAHALLDPPQWIISKLNSDDTRIPSHLFLEYFEIPVSKDRVKKLNKFRRELKSFIRRHIDPHHLTIKPEYLSLFKT